MKTFSLILLVCAVCSANLAVCAALIALGALCAWRSGLFA